MTFPEGLRLFALFLIVQGTVDLIILWLYNVALIPPFFSWAMIIGSIITWTGSYAVEQHDKETS